MVLNSENLPDLSELLWTSTLDPEFCTFANLTEPLLTFGSVLRDLLYEPGIACQRHCNLGQGLGHDRDRS